MKSLRSLFVSDVTRAIPPVVYFHQQDPERLAQEVSEYIITGGWPKDHPNHRRVERGIHEQYVRLLTKIADVIETGEGADLPNVWISGFYGSGKSSFAKLLGLALDRVTLPDGQSLAEAWLARDRSPNRARLRKAWDRLLRLVDPIAVVFDVGTVAREGEHIHSVVLRQIQARLGYSSHPGVASFELKIERDGKWAEFERLAHETLGKPWAEAARGQFPDDSFTKVIHLLYPELFPNERAWFKRYGGSRTGRESAAEAVKAIRDMLEFRNPKATVFVVVDEVSQYLQGAPDRVDPFRAFATALGADLRGKVWLLALGQQRLDQDAGESFLHWAQARFPPDLRAHLDTSNIRDVVHRRLLEKTPEAQKILADLFEKNRPQLRLYGYGCEGISPDEFVDVYPLLPGHVDLLLEVTSALRLRSRSAQSDNQAIRGLLQLLGQLFREQGLADAPVGSLVTWDKIYDIQHTALDSEVQASMAKILHQCAGDPNELLIPVAKTVALLELVQDSKPTTSALVAQCLYDRVDRGNNLPQITAALDELRRRGFLGYSESQGYKIQSSAAEQWERERELLPVARETLSELVQEFLKDHLADADTPKLQGRPFPYLGFFSDGRRADDVRLTTARDDAVVEVDFRFLPLAERGEADWIRRSAETALRNRLIWVCGSSDSLEDVLRRLQRSRAMVERYRPRRDSLTGPRKLLLQQEEIEAEDLATSAKKAVAAAWMEGTLYFRGVATQPKTHGTVFSTCLEAAATQALPTLYPHFTPIQIQPSELLQLLATELAGPSPKFLGGDGGLGILELDGGRFVPSCGGIVPTRVLGLIEKEGGYSGSTLLSHFGSPPYGYTPNVVKAAVAGLLRDRKLRIVPQSGDEITAIRDAGARDVFERDRTFRAAEFFPAGEDEIGPQGRARICAFLERTFGLQDLDRDEQVIADAVAQHFPEQARKLREVQTRLSRLPGAPEGPEILQKLEVAFEQSLRQIRSTQPTVKRVLRHLQTLEDGCRTLARYHAELTDAAIADVQRLHRLLEQQVAQLRALDALSEEQEALAEEVESLLDTPTPWSHVAALETRVGELEEAYVAKRRELLAAQEAQIEEARSRIRRRDGFSLLSAEKSEEVLRPLLDAATDTPEEAVAPPLVDLRDRFVLALRAAEEAANHRLDAVLSEGDSRMISPLDLGLRGKEVKTEADVDRLVEEIRERLLEQLRQGARIRLV